MSYISLPTIPPFSFDKGYRIDLEHDIQKKENGGMVGKLILFGNYLEFLSLWLEKYIVKYCLV